MTQEEKYMDLIAKYLSGNATTEEKDALTDWMTEDEEHQAFFQEVSQLWEDSSELPAPKLPELAAQWQRFESDVLQEAPASEPKGKMRKLGNWRWAAAAAILLPLAIATWLFTRPEAAPPQWAEVRTEADEIKNISLPDGSSIALNENSSISYPADFEERRVRLKGEAFFDVTKQNGKTFTIDNGNSRTTVLGTSFNIRAYPDEDQVEVTVITGKVAVANAQDSILLVPGEKAQTSETGSIQKMTSNSQNEIAWKTKQLSFKDAQLGEIFVHLENYFDVEITCKNKAILDCHYSGKYKNPDLEEILQAIQFSLELEVELRANTYFITGSGCQ